MKKFDTYLRKFWDLDEEDSNTEITDLNLEDPSWFVESLGRADFNDMFEDEDDDFVLVESPKSKKDEIIDSLNYLKSKANKTKQDRESIYTLEMVIKNMK